jgi:hypothetical protein
MSKAITSETEDFWQEHIIAWESSGVCQAAYCKEQGLNYNSFVYQRGRIANKQASPSVKFFEAVEPTVPKETQAPVLQFILPNGVRIGMTAAADARLIQRVISVIGSLKCFG